MGLYPEPQDLYPLDGIPNQRGPNSGFDQASIPDAHLRLEQMISYIRMFMRDYPETNRLIKGVENSNRQIVFAMLMAIDNFNTSPPFTRFGLKSFPSMELLVNGAVIQLIKGVGLLQTRNHISFSDGGLQVGLNDKTPFLQSWLQAFQTDYESRKSERKRAINIESSWGGGVLSEYAMVNSFYGDW